MTRVRPSRGAIGVTLIVVLVIAQLLVVALVLSGGRAQETTVQRIDSVHAFYAAEGGMNMAIRELMTGADHDADNGMGTISNDGNDANDPIIGGGRVHVAKSVSGLQTTLTSTSRAGMGRRSIQLLTSDRPGAMIAYGLKNRSNPQYRVWDGSAWLQERAARDIGAEPMWLVLRGSPLQAHFALACLDSDSDIEVQLWDGAAWGTVFQATNDVGDITTRLFDLAYEQVSGELLLVYRETGTNSVRYRTFDGTSWSAEGTYAMTAGTLKWLKLIPKAGTNEIMVVAMSADALNQIRAAVWNGTAFTSQSALPTLAALSNTAEHAAGAFEFSSGQALAVFNQLLTPPGYRTLSGGAWGGAQNVPSIGANPLWIRLASDPTSDKILMATLDSAQDVNVNAWNGTAWGTNLEVETSAGGTVGRCMDVAFERDSSDALLAYDQNSNTLRYRTWNGSAWSAELSGPNGGNSPIRVVQTTTGLAPGHVVVIWTMDNGEIRTAVWNGLSFGSTLALGISSGTKEYETFMSAAAAYSAPSLVGWMEINP